MKVLKKILIALLIIIAIPLIVALFVSKHFSAEGTATIAKPKQEVFDYIKSINNQRDFGVWFKMDPDIKTTSEGTDGTEGYVYKWESQKVGNGSQTITKIVPGDSILSRLDFGFGEPAEGYFKVKEITPDETAVTWGIRGESPYPWNLMSLFMDMNKDFEKGTQNLKEILEARESPKTGKEKLAAYYAETYANLLKSVEGLSDAQLNFKPGKDRWSVAQCVEHIALTAPELFGYLKKGLDAPENPARKGEVKMTDEDIIKAMTNREHKAKAADNMQPSKAAIDVKARLEQLKKQNDEILAYLGGFSEESLRNRIMDAPFGAVDAYQFALFIPGHTARHTLQAEEVKSDPGFPKN